MFDEIEKGMFENKKTTLGFVIEFIAVMVFQWREKNSYCKKFVVNKYYIDQVGKEMVTCNNLY